MAAKKKATKKVVKAVAPKVDVKAVAIEAKFSELKRQDAAGHKVTAAQLDDLQALVNG